ncbi:endonuclease/exonuclease/phosphatase family protein [Nannocystaceae bacterium ST9]
MTNSEFSAATYNVLANAYVRPDRYRGCPPGSLEPGPRRRLLLDRIAALDVDLLCLQEVEPDAHEAIAARLGSAYAGVYAQRRARPDGASLFVRRSCLSLERHEVLHYRTHAERDDQLALLGQLRLGDRRLLVASTHLQWCADTTPPDQHLGRGQMIELLDHLAREGSGATWILAGDLNAVSQSSVVEVALARGLVLGAKTQRPWDTCNANGRPRKLDYLLVSAGQLDARPGVLPTLRRDTPMPSSSEPSDHLPLRIDFRFMD